MYWVGNHRPRRYEGEEGEDYYSFIYKDKINYIGEEEDFIEGKQIYSIKVLRIDEELKEDEEYICNAIKQAFIALECSYGRECVIKEWPKKVIYIK